MKLLVLAMENESAIANAIVETSIINGVEAVSINPLHLQKNNTFRTSEKGSKWLDNRFKESLNNAYEKIQLSAYTFFVSSNFLELLFEYIVRNIYDAVVCCNNYFVQMMNKLKTNYGLNVLCYSVVTEYSQFFMDSSAKIDGYFLPHDELINEFQKYGISNDSLYATGMPINKDDTPHASRVEARNYLLIPQEKHVYLLKSDGFSTKTIQSFCDEIVTKEDNDSYLIYILVKQGVPIKWKLQELYNRSLNVFVVTESATSVKYIEAADIVLSKSDDIFSTQVSVVGVPLIHLEMVLNYKEKKDFFVSHEMAIKAENIKDAVKKSINLFQDKVLSSRIVISQKNNSRYNSAGKIIQIIKKQVTNRKKKVENKNI